MLTGKTAGNTACCTIFVSLKIEADAKITMRINVHSAQSYGFFFFGVAFMVVMIMGAKGGEYRFGGSSRNPSLSSLSRHDGRAFENRDVCDCIFGTVDRIHPAVYRR